MTEHLERHLREVLGADAARAPVVDQLAARVIGRVRRRRIRQAWVAGAALTLLAAAGLGSSLILTPGKATSVATSPSPSAVRNGPLVAPGSADCPTYDATRIAARTAFSFDGTVRAIGPVVRDPSGGWPWYAPVTFTVHEWFRDASGGTVTVRMPPPQAAGAFGELGETGPSYRVGTRLLVSGALFPEHAKIRRLAWVCGGTTRYYDRENAAAWRAAMFAVGPRPFPSQATSSPFSR